MLRNDDNYQVDIVRWKLDRSENSKIDKTGRGLWITKIITSTAENELSITKGIFVWSFVHEKGGSKIALILEIDSLILLLSCILELYPLLCFFGIPNIYEVNI